MKRRLTPFIALVVASMTAHAHESLEIGGALHRALHAIGTERLVVIGGTLLAILVGFIIRKTVRQAARRSRHEV